MQVAWFVGSSGRRTGDTQIFRLGHINDCGHTNLQTVDTHIFRLGTHNHWSVVT